MNFLEEFLKHLPYTIQVIIVVPIFILVTFLLLIVVGLI